MLTKKFVNKRSLLVAQKAIQFSTQSAEKEPAWGLKYNDDGLKFEKEWKSICEKIENEQRVYLEKEMSSLQQAKVNMLADKLIDLSILETRLLHNMIRERVLRTSGLDPFKVNMDWPSIRQTAQGTWPPSNPNWAKQ